MKDTFKFCVNCGNSTSNNTETRSSTSDATPSRKGRAECATAGITQSSPLAHKLPYPDQGPRRWTEALLRKPDAKSVSVKPGSYIATSLCDPFTTSTATTCNSSGFETLKEISP